MGEMNYLSAVGVDQGGNDGVGATEIGSSG
ncbi:hypothetical protein KOR42_42200 [Thalassoglobus neptunius]|nr:hypothetical protein KOR42_42200 [Thalassoglobus neptunius]